jgi:hypothetical protein
MHQAIFNPSPYSRQNDTGYGEGESLWEQAGDLYESQALKIGKFWGFNDGDDGTGQEAGGVITTRSGGQADAASIQKALSAAESGASGVGTSAAPAVASPSGGRATIRKGSSGDDVAALHTLLKGRGYSISSAEARVKGFGSSTDEAVRAFQGKNGLKVDGWVGKNTWTALGQKPQTAAAKAVAALTGGSSPAAASVPDYGPTALESDAFYKQPWFIPAAVGGVVFVVLATVIIVKA